MKKASLIFVLLINLSFISYAQQTVVIGSQVWMTKNLDVAIFRNGDTIPQATSEEAWIAAAENMQPAWCYYNNDPKNGKKYGKLYNWYAVNDPRGLAPMGFHIPSEEEWNILNVYLDNGVSSGKKMKSISGWNSDTTSGSKTCPNCKDWSAEYRKKVPCHTCKDKRSIPDKVKIHSGNGNNSSGFSGLPGGTFNYLKLHFTSIGWAGCWWSSTEVDKDDANNWLLVYFIDTLCYNVDDKSCGCSVRCLKD
jgi:uncharacterized protein (TIGR02145 family)